MGTYQTTTNQGYQKPHPSNTLAEDVERLRTALDAIDADVAARATVASPTFTGSPAAPTPAAGTNTTQLATTAFVRTEVANLVASSPEALDTLDELAAALGDDPNFASSVNTALANRYTKAEADARFVQGAVQTEMVFTATANQSAFTLSTAVINKPSALVTVDGVVQPTSEYTISQDGLTLTLSEGVPAGTTVRVLALGVASEGAPADDTVTTPKLRDEAVTTEKLQEGSVTADKVDDAGLYGVTSTAVSKTLANRERCTVTAGGQTITLPASPAAGWEVAITIAGTFTNTTVARNGSNIMSLAENMTIDKADVTVTLYYVDATRGWRII
jgi:hypothetical protein